MDAAVPNDIAGPFPAVVILHSGYWSYGAKENPEVTDAALYFLRKGVAVFLVNYYLTPLDTGLPPQPIGTSFPENVQDVACAVRFVRQNASTYNVDSARLGIYGVSAGGHLALLSASMEESEPLLSTARCPSLAGVSHRVQFVWGQAPPGTISEIGAASFNGLTDALVGMLGETYANNPSIYDAASVNTYVSPNDPPVVVGQGDNDTIVLPAWAQSLDAYYTSASTPHNLILVPGANHVDISTYEGPYNLPIRCVAEPLMHSTFSIAAPLVPAP